MKLRPYQETAVQKALDYFNDSANTGQGGLIVAPVGSGKSLILSAIAKELGEKTVVLQPNVELLRQNSEKLTNFGGEFSIYSAKAGFKDLSDMTFATIGSIKNLGKDFKKYGITTVIADEANLFPPKKGSMFRKFVDDLKPKHVVGLTATPCRLYQCGTRDDNYSVLNMLTNRIGREHSYFKNMIETIQVSDMIEGKFWSPLHYELYDFDEGSLRLNSSGSEFTEDSMKKAIQEQGINNSIFRRVKELNTEGVTRNLIFCDCVENAQKLATLIPNSAFVGGTTDDSERAQIIEDFKAGRIWNVFNYGVLVSGFDYPELQSVIMGRPTNSYTVVYQIFGRVVRIHENKTHGRIIDFCNNVKRFGKLEDMTVENIAGFGWGMFSNDKLLTNTRMGSATIMRQHLTGELGKVVEDDDIMFWFGKYNGKKPSECPISYLEWILSEFKINQNSSPETVRLILQCKKIITHEKTLREI